MKTKRNTSGLATWRTEMCAKNCSQGERVGASSNPKGVVQRAITRASFQPRKDITNKVVPEQLQAKTR